MALAVLACAGDLDVASVERAHREEALAGGLAAGVGEVAEGLARDEGGGARGVEVSVAVIGVREGDVALGEAEAIADGVEVAAGGAEQLAREGG
jgi:hypothetical protein